ncbi:integrase, catalytic region, zinc finger, CCHC-type containing protein, partial [Tanacetum coccineum]
MMGNHSKLMNFVEKFIGSVRFGNDHLRAIMGYEDYVMGDSTISIDEMMKSSPICLLSKASKSKSWLWHRCLNHLNFGTINDLARKDLQEVLPPAKNGVVERRNRTLVEAARTMMIFSKALMFL